MRKSIQKKSYCLKFFIIYLSLCSSSVIGNDLIKNSLDNNNQTQIFEIASDYPYPDDAYYFEYVQNEDKDNQNNNNNNKQNKQNAPSKHEKLNEDDGHDDDEVKKMSNEGRQFTGKLLFRTDHDSKSLNNSSFLIVKHDTKNQNEISNNNNNNNTKNHSILAYGQKLMEKNYMIAIVSVISAITLLIIVFLSYKILMYSKYKALNQNQLV